jgi:hypothetical protein
MAKRPKDSPTEKGQRVIWRGRDKSGTIDKIDEDWVWVIWDQPEDGPRICHVFELKIDDNQQLEK